jgi:hypothetical protein
VLRRPALCATALLGGVAVTGASYAMSTNNPVEAQAPASYVLDASQLRSVQQQAEASRADQQLQRQARDTAARETSERIAAERRAAQEEAARKAEAERQAQLEAERRAAAERASRDAVRDPRSTAGAMLGEYGWGADQFGCLVELWDRESGWSHTAANPTSSAYGIPQALPGSKMASAGPDWQTNPITQIRWGLGYIRDSYGSPCSALGHSHANNWY